MNLIPVATGASDWAEVTVEGTPKALFLSSDKPVDTPHAGTAVEIASKAGGNFFVLASGDGFLLREKGLLTAPGTYGVRFLRRDVPVGIEVEG